MRCEMLPDIISVCVLVSVYTAKKEKLSSIFHEEIWGVLTGFSYNNCKKNLNKQTNSHWTGDLLWFLILIYLF